MPQHAQGSSSYAPPHLQVPPGPPLCSVETAAQIMDKNMLILWVMTFLSAKNILSLVSSVCLLSASMKLYQGDLWACMYDKISEPLLIVTPPTAGLRIRHWYLSFPPSTTHSRFSTPSANTSVCLDGLSNQAA